MLGIALLVTGGVFVQATQQQKERRGGQNPGRSRDYPLPTKAWAEGSIIQGNVTDSSAEFAIHFKSDAEATLEYGTGSNPFGQKSQKLNFKAGVPFQTKLSGLKPSTTYSYRLSFKKLGQSSFETSPTYRIQTQRKPGEAFMFFVQGDSHPERVPKMHIPALYERTLLTAEAQKPDLFIMLGDDFSVDTLRERTKQTVEGVYTKQVPYLGLVGHYLVNGNHEQAAKANLDGTPNSLGVWTQNARNRNFVQPAPDAFFSGNTEPVEHIGLLRNYFAWTWGDALFVTIDPYWHSATAVDNSVGKGPKEEGGGGKRNRNLWDITLGETQYKWLTKTLLESKAKYKFVFAHHVNGTGRGAIENATLYEWGGRDPRGGDLFKTKRPGWDLPIHQLFVKAGVSIFSRVTTTSIASKNWTA